MDPTQGSIEAGPSRLPYTGDNQSGTFTARAPVQVGIEPSTTTANNTATTANTLPWSQPSHSQVRSIPNIVPTIIGSDGIRQVPHLFEMCEVEDLIALIGRNARAAQGRTGGH